jgi:hypothetical protein
MKELIAELDARAKVRVAEIAAAHPGAPHGVVREACRADPELRCLMVALVDLGSEGPQPRRVLH